MTWWLNCILSCIPDQTCDTQKGEESWALCLTFYQTYDMLKAELSWMLSCILGGTCDRLKGEQKWMPSTTFHHELVTD